MKKFIPLLSLISSFSFASVPPETKGECKCINCRCTTEQHCGCLSGEECKCGDQQKTPKEAKEEAALLSADSNR